MNKKQCLVCQNLKVKPPVNEWIEEKHYQGSHNIVKEIFVGINNPPNNAQKYGRQYAGSVYYCSWDCFNQQLEQEEEQDFAKGFCSTCGEYLVVLNEQCKDEKHKQEAHYYRLKGGNND
ncbi:hypothetical protein [endosymbiont GvMRE of Glomus versiforme]|uniref:hypothetical protein n=1 Tax=endosymbiont GvMRE of Glomus versiforme TaxID=2039283 RepID=UPI0011C38129|nr:hypothetical protein [endosymbiont GvMRE of Glomus versiforme]